MTAPTISRRIVWLRRCACAAGTVAMVLGMVALGEWAVGLKLWASILPGHRAMLPLTAVTLVLAGLALLLRCHGPARRGASRVAAVCALAVTLVGLLALFVHTLHWNIAIGGATLLDAATLDRAILHAHPLLPAEVSFVLIGLALLKMDGPRPRARVFAQLLALTALFGGLLASTGYVFGVVHPSSVVSLLPYAGVPLDTVAALVVLSAGILAARSDHGLVALFTGGARGGVTRRLVYVLLAIPLVLGSTVWAGLGTGFYDVPLGFALLIAASTALIVALAAVAVRELEQTDVRRRRTEAQYRSLVELAPDAVVVSDRDGRIVLVNSAAEWLFGYSRDELMGHAVETLMPEDLRQRHLTQRAAYHAGVAAKPMGIGIEYRCLRKDGRAFPAEISVGTVENGSDVLVTAVIRDVTQRQRDAEALRASEQRFRTVMDSMSDIVFTLDREQRHVELFGDWPARYGVEAERFIGRTAREVLGPDAGALHEAANRRALAGERVVYEWSIDQPSGRNYFQTSLSPVRAEDGRVVGAVGVARDITRRKHMEETLFKLAVIVESSDDAIIGTALDGTVVSWNRGAETLYGYSAEEIVGRSIDALIPADQRASTLDLRRRLRAGEHIHHFDTVRLRKGGARVHASVSLFPVRDALGKISGISTISRDITERARAEESLRFLAEAGRALSASLDFESTVRTVAQVAVPFLADMCTVHVLDGERTLREVAAANERRDLAGFVEPMRQQTFDLHGEHPLAKRLLIGEARLFGEITDAVLAEIALNPEHLRLLRAMRLRSLILVPIASAGGVVGSMGFGVCGPGRQYTSADLALADALARRAGLAIENARLYREAQAAIRLRNQLLSTVSHDVRNELAAISLTVEALQLRMERQGMPDATRLARDLAKIERAAAKTTGLVSHLLDVGRLQAGQKLNIQRRPCDLVALVCRLADEHQQVSQVHRIRVDARASALVGLWDAARLERVVSNVFDNALRYSPEGGEVVVEVAQVARETGMWAELVVRDQGLGIPTSDLPRIFDWFYRGSNVDERIAGTGVGLASARQIIEQHGGTISATAGDAGGAAFTIRLPMAAAAHTEERPMVHQRGSRRKRGSMPRPVCGDGDVSPQSGPAA